MEKFEGKAKKEKMPEKEPKSFRKYMKYEKSNQPTPPREISLKSDSFCKFSGTNDGLSDVKDVDVSIAGASIPGV